MGMRMYVCVGRLDEWIGGYFKYSDDSIYALLRDNGCDVRDFTGAYNSWVWKVSGKAFNRVVKKVRSMTADNLAKYFRDYEVGDDKKEFKRYVLSVLKDFKRFGSRRDGYYRFIWI